MPAILGSAGLFSLIQFLITRHDRTKATNREFAEQLNRIEARTIRNEIATTRLQLIYLIEERPTNTDTILMTAQRYFGELKGNGEAWAEFHAWAKENKIDIDWYKALVREKGAK